MLSPETALPPPPSPPCTCGKVLADMGPPPTVDEWDNHSIDSKGTLESRRSQGYVSMTSASTYLIGKIREMKNDFLKNCKENF